MDDIRLGGVVRALRIRRRWRQADLAARAGVSRSWVSLAERGHLDEVTVRALRKVCAVLDVRLDLVPRWRGGDLERVVNARHAALHEAVARFLASLPEWQHAPEVSFSIYGERGWIDILAWHAGYRALVVIELKTEIVDPQEIVGVLDRKRRLAAKIARERGWDPVTVSVWLIVADTATNRRRVARHRALFGAALPADGRAFRPWLGRPDRAISGIAFWSDDSRSNASRVSGTTRRVRRQAGRLSAAPEAARVPPT